jgi:murein DD-endopeptidase MepM/ murein hydrolase activator NlpD
VSPGAYQIKVKTNFKTYTSKLNISKKEIPVESFSFATSTTGTSTEAQNNFLKQYLKTLEIENKILGKAWSNKNIILKSEFMRPLKESVVTDIYGYSRSMGTDSLITHKGTDYRAATGTPVYAINKGVVRLVQSFSIYGNTVIIDHGNGLLSMYMHLDKATAKQGYLINKGDEIGLAGATGNVTGPHLHLTIKLNGQSVDPEKFFEAVGVK